MASRRSLQEILFASQERQDLGVLLTERRALRRDPPYEEFGDQMGPIDSAEQMVTRTLPG